MLMYAVECYVQVDACGSKKQRAGWDGEDYEQLAEAELAAYQSTDMALEHVLNGCIRSHADQRTVEERWAYKGRNWGHRR